MRKAIDYTLNNEKELTEFLNHGDVPDRNQNCEQVIRPFVNIMNRCKFYVSPKGGRSKCHDLFISYYGNRKQGKSIYVFLIYIRKNERYGYW